jgi:hypothetical protein
MTEAAKARDRRDTPASSDDVGGLGETVLL